MIYCMSDIRGDFAKYTKMLSKLHLKGTDTLYVLGNVIDGSEGSMKLLFDMMMRENVFPVIGEHEYAALKCLSWLAKHSDETDLSAMDPDTMQKMLDWTALGGQQTIAEFRELTDEQREMIVDYLSDFSLYEEVEAEGTEYVLVHAGIGDFSPDKDMDEYDIHDLITTSPDYSKKYFPDKVLVTGHTPTRRIYEELYPLNGKTADGEPSRYDKAYIDNGHIAVNCGVDIGGRLCAVRLGDLAEFYVE